MPAFEDFVNLELPRRPALLTVDIASYDGDPNGGGAPAIISGAPNGTFYLQETPDTFWRKDSSGAWVEVGSGAALPQSLQTTTEALTFTVDPSDGGAVTGPFSQVFTDMDEVAAALNGETNFRYLQDIIDALPGKIQHSVSISLAAGVHVPNPASIPEVNSAQQFGFLIPSSLQLTAAGAILITGSSTRTVVTSPGTVQSHAVLDRVGDVMPSVTFSGTPFAGQNYKGLYCETSDGALALINSHTDDTLVLQGVLSVEPTDSVTTVEIVRPSTVLRNSNDDSAPAGNTAAVGLAAQCETNFNYIQLLDILIESAGSTAFTHGDVFQGARKTNLIMYRVMSDYDVDIATGTTPNNNYFVGVADAGYCQLIDCVHRAFVNGGLASANRRCDGVTLYGSNVTYSIIRSMMIGMEDAFTLNNAYRVLWASSTIEDAGATSAENRCAILFDEQGGELQFLVYTSGFQAGHKSQIRDCESDGIRMIANGTIGGDSFDLTCEGVAGNCLWVSGNRNLVDATQGTDASQGGIRDGGGNGEWGILVEGAYNRLDLGPDTDVVGTSGFVSVSGTTYANPAALTAAAPVSDIANFNRIDNT